MTAPKTYRIGLSFTQNADFGSIFVPEQCYAGSVNQIGFRDTFLSSMNRE